MYDKIVRIFRKGSECQYSNLLDGSTILRIVRIIRKGSEGQYSNLLDVN